MNAPIASRFDLDGLLDAVSGEPRLERAGVDLTGAVLHDEGWENVVVETVDGWILRFPRAESLPFAREVAILGRLAGRLPAAIPEIAWTGSGTRFAAYRKLSGWAFDRAVWESASTRCRDEFAAGLARFLVAMHTAFDDDEVTELGVSAPDRSGIADRVLGELDHVPSEHRKRVESVTVKFSETWGVGKVSGPTVVLHNDFHLGNMVFTEPLGEPAGVWDFSCVELGVPSAEPRYFVDDPRDLLERMVAEYERISGWTIDLEATVTGAVTEDICDFLETGQPACLERRSWPT